VVQGCRSVDVASHSEPTVNGRVVARDPRNDLALIRMPEGAPERPSIGLRGGRSPEHAAQLYYVDYRLEGTPTPKIIPTRALSVGELAEDSRLLSIFNRAAETRDVFRQGLSGGPLFDQSGDLAGLVIGFTKSAELADGRATGRRGYAMSSPVIALFLTRTDAPLRATGVSHPPDGTFSEARAKAATVHLACVVEDNAGP
jgi:S1-C subfamily serine protease